MVTITSTEFQRRFGQYREAALREPVSITNHGHDSLVLLSAAEYRRLKRRDREVRPVEELGEEFLKALAAAKIPSDQAHLDAELQAWRP